jgi:protein-disulfide isomerase
MTNILGLARRYGGDVALGVIALSALTVATVAVIRLWHDGKVEVQNTRPQAPRRLANWSEVTTLARSTDTSHGAIRVIEFGDYQCPACRRGQWLLDSVAKANKVLLHVAFIHYPLTVIHPLAFEAAVAAECSAAQGRFSAFHHYVYRHQGELGRSQWTALARKAGVPDTIQFVRCLKDSTVTARVSSSAALATRLGINATPTFAIDTLLYPPGLPLRNIMAALAP